MSLNEIGIFKMSQNTSTLFIYGHFTTRCLKVWLYSLCDTLFSKSFSNYLSIFKTYQNVKNDYNLYRGKLRKYMYLYKRFLL
jgi:hypothetical protein